MKLKNTPANRQLKRFFWGVFILFALGLSGLLLQSISSLFAYVQRARVIDDALILIEPRKAEPGRLVWLEDNPSSPRTLEAFTRDKVTNDYRLAYEELTYGLLTGNSSGLRTYFQKGALHDAQQVIAASQRAKFIDWDHKIRLNFYSPDGSVVAFRDTYWYAQGQIDRNDLSNIRIAERSIDIVMNLDDGNWRIHHWRVESDREIPFSKTAFPQLNAKMAAIKGINYMPRSAPFNDFWPGFSSAEVDADFATIKRLGFNTIRIFIPFPAPRGLENLPLLLDLAQNHELDVIPTLLDTYSCYCLEDLPEALLSLNSLEEVLSHPNIILIDIKNEADRDFEAAGLNRTREFLGYIIKWLRTRSEKPFIVGLIAPDPVISELSDVVSLHHYLDAELLEDRIKHAKSYKKPILIEEFGFHSWGLKLPDPHTEREQAWYYQNIIDISKRNNSGWLAWTLYDFPTGAMPGNRRVERHLGILKANGEAKTVVDVLQGQEVFAPSILSKLYKYRYFALIGAILVGLSLLLVFYLRNLSR